MAKTTSNYGLVKPERSDNYNVDVMGDNMDKIDTKIKSIDNITNSGAIKSTSITNSGTITSTGLITGNGGFKGGSGTFSKLVVPVKKSGNFLQLGTITYNSTINYSNNEHHYATVGTTTLTSGVVSGTVNKPNFIDFTTNPIPTTKSATYSFTCNWDCNGMVTIYVYADSTLLFSHTCATS